MGRFGKCEYQEVTEGYEQRNVEEYLLPVTTAQITPEQIQVHSPRQCGFPRQNRDEENEQEGNGSVPNSV